MNESPSSTRWSRVKEIFHGALEFGPEEWAPFLERACGTDAVLRAEVERLLAAHVETGRFIERSPVGAFGRRIGRYELGRQLGAGGMGAVFLARDLELGRDVAVKIGSSSGNSEQLLREAQRASRLNHPHICTVHEVGTDAGQCFIVMEHVDGQRLSDRIPAAGLPTADVLRYGIQAADALGHAHASGVVHCDVKSQNIMVTPDGRVKVLDFGIARCLPAAPVEHLTESQQATTRGSIAGTLSCMSPELLRGAAADTRSDVWALGVLLFEMAVGTRPFGGATGFEVCAAILHESAPSLPPRVPGPLQDVIRRCLEKNPAERYQDARDVQSALAAIRDQIGGSQLHPRRVESTVTSKSVIAVLCAVLLLAGGVAGWRWWDPSRPLVGLGTSGRPTIAVLAFDHLSGGQSTAWLSKGVQSMLLTGLAQTRGLSVVSTQRLHEVLRETGIASLESLDRAQVSDVVRRAGAGATVVGSIVQSGGSIRIDAQVEDLTSGRVLAATSVSGTDVFSLVDQLAARIRDSIGIRDGRGYRSTTAVSTASLEAFRLYSQGLDASVNLRLDDAQRLLRQAVALDPTFAEAHLELALLSGPAGRPIERREFLGRAEAHADRLAEPRRLLLVAELARDQGRYVDAGRSLDELRAAFPDLDAISTMAVQLYTPVVGPLPDQERLLSITADVVSANPSSTLARNNYGYALLYAERFEEAMREFEHYARLAPREPNPFDSLGEAYLVAGMPDEAIEAYSRALTIDPEFFRGGRAWALAVQGRFDEALRDDGSPPYLRAVMLARAGRYREAQETLAAALQVTEAGGDQARLGALRLVSALLAFERHDHERALEACGLAERTVARVPEDRRRFTLALGNLLCGVVELRSGRPEAAGIRVESQRRQYSSVVETDTWWQHALDGEIALAAGDFDTARDAFAKAAPSRKRFFSRLAEGSVLSNDLPFRDGAARLAKAQGDLPGAIQIYRRLLTYGPGQKWVAAFEPRYVLEMARIYEKMGNIQEGRTAYEQFLGFWSRADPDLPELAEARHALSRLNRPLPVGAK